MFVFVLFTDCPEMTFDALNGTKCDNNTIYITKPSTVAFFCQYIIDQDSITTYEWSMDGETLPGDNSQKTDVFHNSFI